MARRRGPKPGIAVLLIALSACAGAIGVWAAADRSTIGGVGGAPGGVLAHRETAADRALHAKLNGGRIYRSFQIDGAPTFPDAEPIELRFAGDGVQPSVGCNQMGGTVIVDDGRLAIVSLSTTDMACSTLQQEEWLTDWLLDGVDVEFIGDVLTLRGGDVRVRLRQS